MHVLPYGYQRGENGKAPINEAEALVVRDIFTGYAVGVSHIQGIFDGQEDGT